MSTLDEYWITELTNVIARWFDDKGCNWDDILSEGLLIAPLAEFLIERDWNLTSERSKKQIFKSDDKYVSFDLCATKQNRAEGPLLIDLKFLKPKKDANGRLTRGWAVFDTERIRKDVRDLIEIGQQCERLFIVALHPKAMNPIDEIKALIKKVVRHYSNSDNEPIMTSGGSRMKVLSCYLHAGR